MKKKFSKALACLLAVIMVATSVPYSALASTEDDYYALTSAISKYEEKMDGTVYTNMKTAYDAYIKAKEYAYAYENGNRTDLDLYGAASALASATEPGMKKWNKIGIESPEINYGGVVPSDYTQNIIYSSTPTIGGGISREDSMFKFITPQYAVVLYGEGDIKIPVMCAFHNNSGLALRSKGGLSFYLNGDEESVKDNNYFRVSQEWFGHYEIEKSGGPASSNDFNWANAWSHSSESDNLPGFDYESDSNTNWNNRGQYQGNNNGDKWWQYASYIKYYGSELAFDNGLQTVPYGWTGHSFRKSATSNSIAYDEYHYYFSGSESTEGGKWGGIFYVIDYSEADESMKTAAGKYFDFSNKAYLKHELDDIFTAVNYLQTEPASGFNNSNYAKRAKEVADGIQKKNSLLTTSNISSSDMSDYNALSSAISSTKSTYLADNSGNKYTADSFADFKAAYEASVAEAAAVADNGFTSSVTSDALLTAYKNLNLIISPSGNAGDTSYDYDSESKTVDVTGPGSTGNYDSGNESPLGGNSDITEVVIDDTVTEIGSYTFADDDNLTTITVPAGATYGEGAFDGCNKLKTVIITGGQLNDISSVSTANAPWQRPSVKVVKFGKGEKDYSVTAIDDDVFTNCNNTAFYFYYNQCEIPDDTAMTLGNNPTIYGYEPSTAKDYATKFGLTFVSLGHDHIWVATVTEPTCTASGYTSYKCQYCDETKENDSYVNALGHNYSDDVIPPTCTERGYTLQTCSRCGHTKKINYTNPTGHTFDMSTAVPSYPTGQPMESSSVQYKHTAVCSTCNNAEKSEYCKFEITGKQTLAGQSYIVFTCSICSGTYLYKEESSSTGEHLVIYQGTSNEIISTERVADGNYPVSVPALPQSTAGSSYQWTLNGTAVTPEDTAIIDDTVFVIAENVSEYTVTYNDENGNYLFEETVKYNNSPAQTPVLPSNTINLADDGHQIYVWKYDGKTVDPSELKITSDITVERTLITIDHNFTDTIITPASCSESGLKSRYCEDCGYTVNNEPIAKTSHTIVNQPAVAATCTTAGKTAGSYCSVCKEVFKVQTTINATGHKWNAGVVTKEPTPYETGIKTYTCSVCKKQRYETLAKLSIAQITPSDSVANKAKVNKSIKKPAGITTISNSKKKQMTVYFNKVAGAQNYRVMYRKAGAKKWTYAWTKGKTEYTFKNLKNGGLYEFQFAGYKKNAKGVWERGNYSKTSYRYYYKAKVKKLKAGKKEMTVTWNKDKNSSGYEIVYGTSSSYSKGKRIKVGKGATSKTIKGLKKGKKYYVWIRSLKKKGGKTYTGEYSTKKTVKVK